MQLQRAYKVELDPNNTQRSAFAQHAGAARWANWGLSQKIETYKATKKSPSAIELHRNLNVLKGIPKEDGGVPWMYEVSKCAPQEALRDLDKAFKSFFRNCKKGSKKKGFPHFKSRHKSPKKFRLYGSIRVSESKIKLPNIGWVRLKQSKYLPGPERGDVEILSASLSERADRWFVSLSCKVTIPDQVLRPRAKVVGVDVGIKTTTRALLTRRKPPIRLNDFNPSPRSLVADLSEELTQRSIRDSSAQPAILQHPRDIQGLDANHIRSLHNLGGHLVPPQAALASGKGLGILKHQSVT